MRRSFRLVAVLTALPLLTLACSDDPGGDLTSSSSSTTGGSGGDGGADPFADLDDDGHDSIEHGGDDCDDSDATVYPGADDVVGDGVDQNCDGLDGVDSDADGHASQESGGLDCDDAESGVHPGASDDGVLGDTVIHNTDWATQSTAIAVDSAGSVHIGYGDKYMESGNLVRVRPRYLTNASGTWEESGLDNANSSGSGIAIAMADDVLHTVYGGDVRYASRDTSASDAMWNREDLGAGYAANLLIDSSGHPHIAVRDTVAYEARHVYHDGEQWVSDAIGATDLGGVAVALDESDQPHMAWGDGDVLYVGASSDGFTPELAHAGDANGMDFIFDEAGNRHLLFFLRDASTGDGVLHHASDESGAWQSTELFDIPTLGGSISIKRDSAGTLHAIIGFSHYGSHVHYGVKAPGASWSFYPLIVNDADRGTNPSFTLTDDGTVHLAYVDYSSVFYASIAAADGVDNDCDGNVW
jgi:hypothetical protein